jgi:DNA polymerase-3 subunit gamma/tau
VVLRAMVRQQSVPPALIFGGSRGTGKTSAARILAAALNCTERAEGEAEPCGKCGQCEGVWLSNSSSVIEVDAASSGGVEDVRKLRDITLYAHSGTHRVIMLDEVHSASRDAFNALLKTLEEPPPKVVFVLLTTETGKIPETIRSRAMSFEFRRIRPAEIVERLLHIAAAESIAVDEDLAAQIARQAKGGLRDAVMLLDQVRSIGISKGSDFREWYGIADTGLELVRVCLSGEQAAVVECCAEAVARTGDAGQLMAEATEVLRDIIVIRAGGEPPCLAQQLEARAQLAVAVDPACVAEALRVLWRASGQLRYEEDQVLAAQVVGVILADTLRPKADQPIPQAQWNGRGAALTLDEMQSMVAALGG